MYKIIVVDSSSSIISKDRIEQVKDIFRKSFPNTADYAERISSMLKDPLKQGFSSSLIIAELASGIVGAFALVLNFPGISCSFLDFFAVNPSIRGGGIGSSLYEAVKEHCRGIGSQGLYMEVQPDQPEYNPDPEKLSESKRRIRFYERLGARVIISKEYAEPVGQPPTNAYLMYDDLGYKKVLTGKEVKDAIGVILIRRFGKVVDPVYLQNVLNSFYDSPVLFREVRKKRTADKNGFPNINGKQKIPLVVNLHHKIHHITERDYFERPVRIDAILAATNSMGAFNQIRYREHGDKSLYKVHDNEFIQYLRTVCPKLKEGRPFYPDTFPIRQLKKRPKALMVQAGYYCIDTGTPLNRNAYIAAKNSIDVALTGADEILRGAKIVYSVCRPPGHHAGKNFFGGFCYFNNAAIAASYLSEHGKVAILDIDFHHGNGTQDIFYDSKLLTISIHGHPDYNYPYFSGYQEEEGNGKGKGYNFNFPLLPNITDDKYILAFKKSIRLLSDYNPAVLIVCLGYDILKGDPTGSFTISLETMKEMAKQLTQLKKPLLVIQEGGYNLHNIRRGSIAFFGGLLG